MQLSICRVAAIACGLLVATTLGGGAVSAQGFYYKQLVRDGRIYVFNNAEEADRFEKSGVIGRAITGPDTGPNGETVVGDSERALQLFYFKHGIPAVVPEPASSTLRVEWRDGKTRVTTDDAHLEISSRVQMRFTQEIPDDMVHLGGVDDAGDPRGSFRIRRAKFKLEGWFWHQDRLSYEVQVNWPAVAGSNSGALLEDASLAWDPAGSGRFRIVLGQFKAPMGRQELTSSGNQQFVDRSLVSNEYARGRDTGIAVQGVLFGNRLEYRAGMFNGNGLTRATNDNDTFQYNGRVMWQPNGNQNLAQRAWVSGALYSEADFESTTRPLYAFGLNLERDDFFRTVAAPASANRRSSIVGVDGVFKYAGLFATGEWYWRQTELQSGPVFHANGWYLQGGRMLNRARTWEAAAR